MQAGEGAAHDFGPMKETLTKIIAECAVAVPVKLELRVLDKFLKDMVLFCSRILTILFYYYI